MSAYGSRLTALTRELWAKWLETKSTWRDTKALEFESKYLSDLRPSVDKTVTVIDELEKVLGKIRSDCS